MLLCHCIQSMIIPIGQNFRKEQYVAGTSVATVMAGAGLTPYVI